jgi:hypothetical protein
MGLLDDLKGVLSQYATGGTPSGDPGAHFTQVAQNVEPGVLASGIAAAMHSDQTPPFGQLVSQMFANGTPDQKAAMLNTLLGSVTPDQRAKIASRFPGLGNASSLNPTQVSALSPSTVQDIAQHVEGQDASIVEKMSSMYAAHPGLVRTLGSMAMIVALRKIAQHQTLRT